MDRDLRRLAVARVLAYLERCGARPDPAARSRVEHLVDGVLAGGDEGLFDRVFDALPHALPEAVTPAGCACPPIRRASMGYPEP